MVKFFGTRRVQTWSVAPLLASACTPLHAQPGTATYPTRPVRVKSGRIIGLAVTSGERWPAAANKALREPDLERNITGSGLRLVGGPRASSPTAYARTSRAGARSWRRRGSSRSEEKLHREGRGGRKGE